MLEGEANPKRAKHGKRPKTQLGQAHLSPFFAIPPLSLTPTSIKLRPPFCSSDRPVAQHSKEKNNWFLQWKPHEPILSLVLAKSARGLFIQSGGNGTPRSRISATGRCLMNNALKGWRKAPGRCRATPVVEALEARRLLSISVATGGSPTLIFPPAYGVPVVTGGGMVRTDDVPVYLIFAGGSTGQFGYDGTVTVPQIVDAVQKILSSPYLSRLAQYGVTTQAHFSGGYISDASLPPLFPFLGGFLDTSIASYISDSLQESAGVLPEPNDTPDPGVYFVFTPTGDKWYSADGKPEGTGWHSYGALNDGENASFGVITSNRSNLDNSLDNISETFSHELVETLSNPQASLTAGVVVTPTPAYEAYQETLSIQPDPGTELCDNEARYYAGYENGVAVQSYWSKADLAYIVTGGAQCSLSSVSTSVSRVLAGGSFSIDYDINSPAEPNVLIGATLKFASREYDIGSASGPQATFSPGSNSLRWDYQIPSSTPVGTYDLVTKIWRDANGDGRIDRGDVVLSRLTVPAAVTVSVPAISGFNTAGAWTANEYDYDFNGLGWGSHQAVPNVVGNSLQLTNTAYYQATSFFYNQRVDISDPFTVSFTYQHSGGTATPADGVAFVLQNDLRGASAIGMTGSGLGYGNASYGTGSRILTSDALEINIYQPYGIGAGLGTGGYTYGSAGSKYPSLGAVDILNDPVRVTFYYDGAGTSKYVYTDLVTGASTSQMWSTPLAAAVGNTAYIGFTGGTGASNANQYISDFSYSVNKKADITNSLNVVRGGYHYNFSSKIWSQVVTVTNTTANAIGGEIDLLLEGLTFNTTLNEATGIAQDGSYYITLASGPLLPGQSVTVTLLFSQPSLTGFSYVPRVEAGPGIV